jgi:Spy/CpxP family protein refolding chaperone
MKRLTTGLLILGAAGMPGALLAQTASDAPAPPPPPAVQMPPGMAPNGATPAPPAAFHFTAPVGLQSRFTYLGATSHKDDLKLTDDQVKQIGDLYQKGQTDAMARSRKMMGLRDAMNAAAQADPLDMAKVESAVRAVQNAQGDDIIADVRLNDAMLKVLNADQRAKLKDMPPSFGFGGGFAVGGSGAPGMRPPMPPMHPMPGMPGMNGGMPPTPPQPPSGTGGAPAPHPSAP